MRLGPIEVEKQLAWLRQDHYRWAVRDGKGIAVASGSCHSMEAAVRKATEAAREKGLL